jgi:hypothetical protein
MAPSGRRCEGECVTRSSGFERVAHARVDLDDSPGRVAVWRDLILAVHLLEAALDRQARRDGGTPHGHFKLLVLLDAADRRTRALKSLTDSLRFPWRGLSPGRIFGVLPAP